MRGTKTRNKKSRKHVMKKAFIIWLALAVASGCSKADGPAPGYGWHGGRLQSGRRERRGLVVRRRVLNFPGGGVGLSSGGATRAMSENLAPGSTVRVLAYTRRAAEAAADIERDTYVAEATYRVKDDYSLEPCVVDGMTGVATGTAGASPMRLRTGTYDFYALTPALSLTGHKEASVAHGTDYACSLTAACAVATRQDVSTQTVVLATLERKCSRLAFSITRKAENVAKAVINSVGCRASPVRPLRRFFARTCRPEPTTAAMSFRRGPSCKGRNLINIRVRTKCCPRAMRLSICK